MTRFVLDNGIEYATEQTTNKDSKGLEALSKFYSLALDENTPFRLEGEIQHNLDIIETELKRLEELERDVKTWKEVAEHKENEFNIIHKECERLTHIKNKQDEILRIIKEKDIDIGLLRNTKNALEYNIYKKNGLQPTEKEYDLLKEVLK